MDRSRDARRVEVLVRLFQHAVVVVFAVLAVGFWHLQIRQHARFAALADDNHYRRLPLPAPRGVVLDRDGRVLVGNRGSWNIMLVDPQVDDLDAWAAHLAQVTHLDPAAVSDAVDRHRRDPASRPVVIVRDASLAQVSAVAARKLDLPGVVIEPIRTRHYPAGRVGAHLIGYVGEIMAAQAALPRFEAVPPGAIVGHAGIEYVYNDLLMGIDGARDVVVNSVGREMQTIRRADPRTGRRVRLTIDADLQHAAEAAFAAAGFTGAAVVLDPQTGDVLALVSLPAYDPNVFAAGLDRGEWAALSRDAARPLQNRALRGRYSPGSIFKIIMAIAALEQRAATPDFQVTCRGGAEFYGRFFRCHSVHGRVGLEQAIEKSCNTYFYTLGQRLDIDRIHEWATAFGLGRLSGIDLPHEIPGLVPSRAWKRDTRGDRWYAGETISVAIGQGQLTVTPVSLAVMMAAVANGGRLVTPRVLAAYEEAHGWTPAPPGRAPIALPTAPETLEVVQRGLWRVVNGAGTGRRARLAGRDVIGKTGTAQVISRSGRAAAAADDRRFEDHGLFVFAAPREDPRIAGVVLAEHGGHGYLAAGIARRVMAAFFAKADGRRPERTAPPPAVSVADRAPAPRSAAVGGGG